MFHWVEHAGKHKKLRVAVSAGEFVISGHTANMWTCQHCRETNEASFDICWNCGTTKDGIPDQSFHTADDLPSEHLAAGERHSEKGRCICPGCRADVAGDATQCPRCGERFPAMADRQRLRTPETYDIFRAIVLTVAIVLALPAIIVFVLSLFTIGR